MKRTKVTRSRSRRSWKNGVKTNKRNIAARPMRGGIRL